MEYGLTNEKLNQIPNKIKQEIVEAVREGMKHVSIFGNGITIIYGETHMPRRKRNWRKRDIEWESLVIALKINTDYRQIRERFMQEMRELSFIRGV